MIRTILKDFLIRALTFQGVSANGTPKTVQLLTEKDFEKVPVGQGRNPEKAQAVLLRQLKNAKTAARKQKLRLRLLKYIE